VDIIQPDVSNAYVLIVDDNILFAEMIASSLQGAGYRTSVVHSGLEVLERVTTDVPDLVLLDISMPDMTGYDVCRALRQGEATQFVPIIIVTGLTDMEDKIEGLEAGADDFLSKPIQLAELLTRVKSLLRIRFLMQQQRENDRLQAELRRKLEIEQLRREEEVKRRQFYKEVIYAVTNARLILVEPDELEVLLKSEETVARMAITKDQDPGLARKMVGEIAGESGMEEERIHDIVVGVSEATTNVLTHAGEGEMLVQRKEDRLHVWIRDQGPGIDFASLPKAVLTRGFSTKFSLGLGYTMLLGLMDRIYLCTDSSGTTVVLEKTYATPARESDLEALLAAWPEL